MSYIYIASPYSKASEVLREGRFKMAVEYCAFLLNLGMVPYSPIVHCHPIAVQFHKRVDFETWKHLNVAMLQHAWRLDVLCLEGWQESVGVAAEIALARELQLKVYYIYCNEGRFVAHEHDQEVYF